MVEELFAQAVSSTGETYVKVRNELLGQGPPAVAFLREKAGSEAPEEDRWLAEIMLARAEHPDEMRALEQDLHDKVLAAKWEESWPLLHYRERSWRRLPLAGEPPPDVVYYPWEEPKPKWARKEPSPQASSREDMSERRSSFDERWRRYWESIRISDSPLWRPLLGEILLKGWIGSVSRGNLAEEDYVYQAVCVLGSMEERRAAPRILEVLQDPKQDPHMRAGAAGVLPGLGHPKTLDAFLALAESDQTPYHPRSKVFEEIALMKDLKAIPALERIADLPIPPRDSQDHYERRRWRAKARKTMRIIQRENVRLHSYLVERTVTERNNLASEDRERVFVDRALVYYGAGSERAGGVLRGAPNVVYVDKGGKRSAKIAYLAQPIWSCEPHKLRMMKATDWLPEGSGSDAKRPIPVNCIFAVIDFCPFAPEAEMKAGLTWEVTVHVSHAKTHAAFPVTIRHTLKRYENREGRKCAVVDYTIDGVWRRSDHPDRFGGEELTERRGELRLQGNGTAWVDPAADIIVAKEETLSWTRLEEQLVQGEDEQVGWVSTTDEETSVVMRVALHLE